MENFSKINLAVAVLCTLFAIAYAPIPCYVLGIYCEEEDCESLYNAPPCLEGEIMVHRGSFCGCCDICVTPQREGERCIPHFASLDIYEEPLICAEGLICSDDTGNCMKE